VSDRFRDDGSPLQVWAEPEVLVECPCCNERAVVRPIDGGPRRRLTCPQCGLSKEADGATSSWGAPVDPWFGAPLWLRADFRGQTVWAYNPAHLARLREFVAATQRERTPKQGAAMSMLDKLPGWMTSAGNREGLVRVLDRLAASV